MQILAKPSQSLFRNGQHDSNLKPIELAPAKSETIRRISTQNEEIKHKVDLNRTKTQLTEKSY